MEKWNRDVGEVLREGIGILDGCREWRVSCRAGGSKGGYVM